MDLINILSLVSFILVYLIMLPKLCRAYMLLEPVQPLKITRTFIIKWRSQYAVKHHLLSWLLWKFEVKFETRFSLCYNLSDAHTSQALISLKLIYKNRENIGKERFWVCSVSFFPRSTPVIFIYPISMNHSACETYSALRCCFIRFYGDLTEHDKW